MSTTIDDEVEVEDERKKPVLIDEHGEPLQPSPVEAETRKRPLYLLGVRRLDAALLSKRAGSAVDDGVNFSIECGPGDHSRCLTSSLTTYLNWTNPKYLFSLS